MALLRSIPLQPWSSSTEGCDPIESRTNASQSFGESFAVVTEGIIVFTVHSPIESISPLRTHSWRNCTAYLITGDRIPIDARQAHLHVLSIESREFPLRRTRSCSAFAPLALVTILSMLAEPTASALVALMTRPHMLLLVLCIRHHALPVCMLVDNPSPCAPCIYLMCSLATRSRSTVSHRAPIDQHSINSSQHCYSINSSQLCPSINSSQHPLPRRPQ